MTIIEAIKSGKAFKRDRQAGCYSWGWFRVVGEIIMTVDVYLLDSFAAPSLEVSDILADDWIVMEE